MVEDGARRVDESSAAVTLVMPGIVGLVTKMPRGAAEAVLAHMIAAVRRDVSDETGAFVAEREGVYLGWCRRAGAESSVMPIELPPRDAVLMFSGDEYSGEAASRLARVCRSAADDESFPSALNGRFHGCVFDRATGALTLFNDRYGMHRLYYCQRSDTCYFAAEAKAILAIDPGLRAIEPQSLGEFVTCGCVLENRTLFRDVHVLPPASSWDLAGGTVVRRRQYFDPREWEGQAPLAEEDFYEELRATFARALPRYFDGDTRVGMSLTGGLDTRMIMAWHRATPSSMPCYTFGGSRRDSRDVSLARRIAEACGQRHEVITIGATCLQNFGQYADRAVWASDGTAHARHGVDVYANERAAAIAPVRMTGNYGSEVLRQIPAFRPVRPAAGVFTRELAPHFEHAERTYATAVQGSRLSFALFRQAPWYHYGLSALERAVVDLRTPYLDNELVRCVFRAPASATATRRMSLRLIADGRSELARIPTDRERWLDEVTFKAEYAYDYGMPQWLVRADSLVSGLHLERHVLGRHKAAHFRVWYRDELAPYLRDVLLDSRSRARSYLDSGGVERVVRRHLDGTRNHTSDIHVLLTLELIHRLLLDHSGSYASR